MSEGRRPFAVPPEVSRLSAGQAAAGATSGRERWHALGRWALFYSYLLDEIILGVRSFAQPTAVATVSAAQSAEARAAALRQAKLLADHGVANAIDLGDRRLTHAGLAGLARLTGLTA